MKGHGPPGQGHERRGRAGPGRKSEKKSGAQRSKREVCARFRVRASRNGL